MASGFMKIYCCGCEGEVIARLITGRDVYPHRPDLYSLPFWKCETCENWVGCHHKTKSRTRPLGAIPTPEIKKARGHIHRLIDPLWKKKLICRGELYGMLSDRLGWKYHTADIRTIEQAREVYKVGREIKKEILT